MKKITRSILLFMLIFSLAACSAGSPVTSSTSQAISTSTSSSSADTQQDANGEVNTLSVNFSKDDLDTSATGSNVAVITLDGKEITFEGVGATISGTVITITYAGIYVISGNLQDGQIIVDTESAETVHLILNGASLTSSTSAPIYIRKADKVVITLAENTQNTVSDGTAYLLESGSDEPNAAIFSKSDLTFNGSGSLLVNGNYDNGIASKDDLKFASGNITVTAVNDALRGRDSISVLDGTFTLTAGGDGMQSNNDVDADKGFVSIAGGTFNITADNDGIQAETDLLVKGGDFSITTGGGSVNGSHADQGTSTVSTSSAKGLKAGLDLTVTGGMFVIDSADTTLHSGDNLTVNGGSFLLTSGNDGIHSDNTLTVNGGDLTINGSYEGIESKTIIVTSGTIYIQATDDGINASSGSSTASVGKGGNETSDSSMVISGGTIYVDANGDGIDINGPIEMSAGLVIVNGPTADNNGSLDYTGTFTMTGGFLVAVGSSGMAQAPSLESTQYSLLYAFDAQQPAGSIINIQTSSGEEVLTFVPTKTYQSIVLSSPELTNGSEYLIFTGGTSSGTVNAGLYSDGTYSAGTQVATLTLSGITTIAGNVGTGRPGRSQP